MVCSLASKVPVQYVVLEARKQLPLPSVVGAARSASSMIRVTERGGEVVEHNRDGWGKGSRV